MKLALLVKKSNFTVDTVYKHYTSNVDETTSQKKNMSSGKSAHRKKSR